MQKLTKVEEEVMHIIWEKGPCFVKEIIEIMPLPKPPYSTISSVVRILEKKKFVAFHAYGKTHQYYPLVKKEDYIKIELEKVIDGYFSGSFKNLVSFFTHENKLSQSDIKELQKIIKEAKTKKL